MMTRTPERGGLKKFGMYVLGGIVLGEVASMGFGYGLELTSSATIPPWEPFALAGLTIGAPIGALGYGFRNTNFVRGLIEDLKK